MDSKKVYLVQINVTYSKAIAYLPYAAGCLAAYAWDDDEIKQSYELAEILCVRHPLDESFAKIKDPIAKYIIHAVVRNTTRRPEFHGCL